MQTVASLPPCATRRYVEPGDRYLTWLGWILLGYALLGRGFAYLGVPPLYVGEATVLAGLAILTGTRGAVTSLFQLPLVRGLLLFMAWGAICTAPYLSTYGIDALRDAVLWGYGCYALVVAGLLVDRPDRLKSILLRYRGFVVVVAALAWLVLALKGYGGLLPRVPGSRVPIVQAKSADVLVHAAAALSFILLGMRRSHPLLIVMLALPLLMGNRAGMVGGVAAVGLAALLSPAKARVGWLVYALGCLLLLVALFRPTVTIGRTEISTELLLVKAGTIFGEAEQARYGGKNYNNTREWRLEWWGKIAGYTFEGPYFWTGKGYGINLSVDDGFKSGAGEDLRSPHNGHMTVLARSGVPGFVLWLLIQLGWLWGMIRHYVQSRAEHDPTWMSVFAFLTVYWVAFMLIASFEVTLESPMGGIWMWTIYGTGLAAMHVHRHHPEAVHDGDVSTPSV